MEKPSQLTTKKVILIIAGIFVLCGLILGAVVFARNNVKKVASEKEYEYVNPDEIKAATDEGFVIDGVLDEEQYQSCNWLYLHNTDGGADVNVAMTSYYGDKGMYIVYDVTESTPIYVNPTRASYYNSGIEMYLASSDVSSMKSNHIFEIDMLPTGDLNFRQRTGRNNFINAATVDESMARLGATTKGGEVNTEECNGYNLELFVPWDYMDALGLDSSDMEKGFVYINPVHITSYNYTGTNSAVDRYWYSFATQLGGDGWGDVSQYFRFGARGVLGAVPINLVEGENYTIVGDKSVIPGMMTTVTITPEKGYALNSILVNGEEYIKKVSYNEDGSVTLKVRGVKEGLTISASVEPVTEGNKTLSGIVKVHKLGGDSLEGVSLSYLGPTGEKPITFDSSGRFELKDLAQGYYKITAEKAGYPTLVRGIYLNRDIETELTLEYQMFKAEKGYNWILDNQNDGILNRFGGSGAILSADSYKKFAVEANFRYDAELAELSKGDNFLQQRSGIRIAFSNGKYWRTDLLYSNGKYRVQYAKESTGSVFDWKTIYTMTDEEIAKYKSEDGIQLKILRDGQYANVYLGGKLIAVEKLDDEYIDATAQIGFEAWVANQEVTDMKYNISTGFTQNIKNYYFAKPALWDITRQYEGIVSLPNGGNGGYLEFAKQYANMDLTLTVRDYDDEKKTAARTDVLFVFENGAHVSFGVNLSSSGKGRIQSMNLTNNDGKQIYDKWTNHGNMTEAESAKYKTEGIQFRIVRIGTEVSLYIDGRFVGVADLTNNNSGVTADMKATVSLRHYDDEGVRVDIPFSITENIDKVTVTSVEGNLGKVATQKQNYFVGDTIILSGDAKDGYYMTGLKVNGTDVSLNWDGTYTFKATEKNYTVEGTFDKAVFKDNKKWNLLSQNKGIVSLPNGGSGGNLEFYNQYTDIDLTLTARDYADAANKAARTDVLFVFENGAHVSFGINCSSSGKARIQSLNNANDDGKQIYNKYTNQGNLTEEETALYKGDGVDFRVVRIGTEVSLYIGDRLLKACDLTNNNSGVTENMKATVYLRHYDDAGVQVDIPFEVTDKPNKVTVTIKNNENKNIVTNKNTYVVGDKVVVTAKEGYYCNSLNVNDSPVALAMDGTYTFTAEESSYTIEGTIAKKIFADNSDWNLLQQNQSYKNEDGVMSASGVVSLPSGGKYILDFLDKYTDMDLTVTVRDYADSNNTTARNDVRLYLDTNNDGKYSDDVVISFGICGSKVESITKGITKSQYRYGNLTTDEKEKLTTTGVDLRIVRKDTKVYLYVEDRQVCKAIDLTTYYADGAGTGATGVTANTKAMVTLRHWDDAGVQVDVPYTITNKVEKVTINDVADTIETANSDYFVGDTVIVAGKEGYYCTSMEVNGTSVTLADDATYTFKAEEASYDVKAAIAKKIFADNSKWDLSQQNQGYENKDGVISANGVVSLPGGDDQVLKFYDRYADIDLTLKDVKEHGTTTTPGRTDVLFEFDTNDDGKVEKTVSFGVVYKNGAYVIETLGVSSNYIAEKRQVVLYTLDTEAAKYLNEGIELRVIRSGINVYVLVEDKQVAVFDLSQNSSGVTADMKATVSLRHYDAPADNVVIPYEVSNKVNEVALNITNTANGTITANQINYLSGGKNTTVQDSTKHFIGEEIVLTAEGKGNYYCTGMKINGTDVAINNGTYTFTATEANYTVEGIFTDSIFVANSNWDLSKEKEGIVSLPNGGGSTATALQFVKKYTDIDLTLTVRDYADTKNTAARTGPLLVFDNGKYVCFTVTSGGTTGYRIQTMGGIHNYVTLYNLTEAEIALYKGTEGLDFRVVRLGTEVYLYINGKQVAVCDLAANDSGVTADMEATVSIRHYDDAGVKVDIPFSVTDEFEKVFVDNTAWDLSKQYVGIVSLPNGGGSTATALQFVKKYTDMDLTLTVRDYADTNNTAARTGPLLVFDNGKYVCFTVTSGGTTGYRIQTMGGIHNYVTLYNLTEAEIALYKGTEGLDFRVVRSGTDVYLYINGKQVAVCDLAANSSGVTADMEATVSIRHYDDAGVKVDIPFTVK